MPTRSAPRLAQGAEGGLEVLAAAEASLLGDRKGGDDGNVGEVLEDVEGEEEFGEVGEGLQEKEIAPAVEEGADLFPVKGAAVVVGKGGIGRAELEGADGAADVDILPLRRFGQEAGGLPVDLAHLPVEAVAGEAEAVRAEAVRFHDAGPGGDVVLVDAGDEVGPAQVRLLQAGPVGDAQGVEVGAGGAVADEDALLKFVQ